MTDILLPIVMALFPLSEIALAVVKRSRTPPERSHDRGSLRLLWMHAEWVRHSRVTRSDHGCHPHVLEEERALRATLGLEYAAYCARTKRFIPGLV